MNLDQFHQWTGFDRQSFEADVDPPLQAMAQSIEQAESKAMQTCDDIFGLAHHVADMADISCKRCFS